MNFGNDLNISRLLTFVVFSVSTLAIVIIIIDEKSLLLIKNGISEDLLMKRQAAIERECTKEMKRER